VPPPSKAPYGHIFNSVPFTVLILFSASTHKDFSLISIIYCHSIKRIGYIKTDDHLNSKEGINMAKDYSEVVVTDIKMPFGSMVLFMVKWAIATIPALVLLSVIGSIIFGILSAIWGGFHRGMGM
jgi:hypothetical protein